MFSNLLRRERETLVKLGKRGPAANLDQIALCRLFTLGLVEVNSKRHTVLTLAGCRVRDEIVSTGFLITDDSCVEIPTRR